MGDMATTPSEAQETSQRSRAIMIGKPDKGNAYEDMSWIGPGCSVHEPSAAMVTCTRPIHNWPPWLVSSAFFVSTLLFSSRNSDWAGSNFISYAFYPISQLLAILPHFLGDFSLLLPFLFCLLRLDFSTI